MMLDMDFRMTNLELGLQEEINMTYRNCKKLIEAGRYEYSDMMNKLDVFLLGDRVTQEQYEELVKMMESRREE